MPSSAFFGFFFAHTYQSRYFDAGSARRFVKPGMLVRCVVDDQIDHDPHAALFAAVGEFDKVAQRAVRGIDAVVVGDVVAAVAAGRRLKRHQPDGCDSQALQIVEPAHQP